MDRFKILSRICIVLAILLSDIMCAAVSYEYCALQWGGRYEGWSAPPSAAFVYAVPFAAGIVLCIILSRSLGKRASQHGANTGKM